MQMKRVRLLPLSCTEEQRQSSPYNSAQARLDRAGNVLSAGLGDHLGGEGSVVHGNDIHAGETVEEVAALVDGLLVGIHFLDIGEVRAGINQKIVVDFQPEGADDGEIVLDHQVVHLVHGTGGGIFDGRMPYCTAPDRWH